MSLLVENKEHLIGSLYLVPVMLLITISYSKLLKNPCFVVSNPNRDEVHDMRCVKLLQNTLNIKEQVQMFIKTYRRHP